MWFDGHYCLTWGRSLAISNAGSGGGLANGCAVDTEQCQQQSRPYQVPSGIIRYSPGTLSHPCVLCTVYRVPCTVRCHRLLVSSCLCPSLFGAKPGMYVLVPSLFGDISLVGWCCVLSGVVRYLISSAFALPYLGQS